MHNPRGYGANCGYCKNDGDSNRCSTSVQFSVCGGDAAVARRSMKKWLLLGHEMVSVMKICFADDDVDSPWWCRKSKSVRTKKNRLGVKIARRIGLVHWEDWLQYQTWEQYEDKLRKLMTIQQAA